MDRTIDKYNTLILKWFTFIIAPHSLTSSARTWVNEFVALIYYCAVKNTITSVSYNGTHIEPIVDYSFWNWFTFFSCQKFWTKQREREKKQKLFLLSYDSLFWSKFSVALNLTRFVSWTSYEHWKNYCATKNKLVK